MVDTVTTRVVELVTEAVTAFCEGLGRVGLHTIEERGVHSSFSMDIWFFNKISEQK